MTLSNKVFLDVPTKAIPTCVHIYNLIETEFRKGIQRER